MFRSLKTEKGDWHDIGERENPQIVEIRKLIRELGREKTVILSTHILPEVEATCDRILIIHNGRIVADGSSDTLRKQAQGQEMLKVRIEDGDSNTIFSEIQKLPSVSMVDFIERSQNFFQVQSHPDNSSRREVFNLCVEKIWVIT